MITLPASTLLDGLGHLFASHDDRCDCGEVTLPVGALSVWMDGVTHTETACIGGAA